MTTKNKIIGGFLVMILLSMGLAGFGYMYIQAGSEGFDSYSRQSRVNVAVSDMATALAQAVTRTYDFVSGSDPKTIEEAEASIATFMKIADTGIAETHIPYRRDAIINMKKEVEPLGVAIQDLYTAITTMTTQDAKTVQPSFATMVKSLRELGDAAHTLNQPGTLYAVEKTWSVYAECLSAISRYAATYAKADADMATSRLNALGDSFTSLGTQIVTDEGRRIFAELMNAYTALKQALTTMTAMGEKVRDNLVQIHATERRVADAVTVFNTRIDKEMRAEGKELLASSEKGQNTMLGVSVVGIILGVLLAAFAILGLIRVLRDMAAFSEAIAAGDFNYRVTIREKGEIGAMLEAMKAIPNTLAHVLDQYKALESSVERGSLDAKGKPEEFRGGFATLIGGTNAILGRFLSVLESLPSPVVVLDKDLKASYINAVARSLAGESYKGKTCFEMFAREDFGSERDALKRAMATKSPASAETRAHPQGKEMDINYTAIPMFNAQGQVSSVLQLITDLTPLKAQQKTMFQIATQASEISNRVAAASEELSAQVEQVSRGAEVQRERVEATASAMTEMNATVLEVARNAGQASEQSEGTRLKATEGADLVNQVVGAINDVNAVGHNLQTNMQELGKQAESIGSVMNVISDIADQTNLLALNAAIEAARAGEAGRGFAVVADEVRKLAEKTMHATQEVGASITAVQQSARVNIGEVGKAVEKMGQATTLANASGSALAQIVNLASANSTVVTSIATAAEEQSATSEEISRALGEINQVVAETTDGMTQSSAAVQELSRMAQELRTVMSGLR